MNLRNKKIKWLVAGAVVISLPVCIGDLFAEEGHGHYQLQGDVVPIGEDGIHDPANDAVNAL